MARKKGLTIDPRVNIAMDALTLSQRKAVSKVLQDREHFLDYTGRPGSSTQKLSAGKTLYKTRVGSSELRLIYSVDGDMVSVLDLMNNRTMNRLGPKKKKSAAPKKNASHTVVE